MCRKILMGLAAAAVVLTAGGGANADLIITWDSGSGLAGEANVSLLTPRQLQVVVNNTSTALPPPIAGDTSNQLLTSVSFNLPGGIDILGGTAILGADGRTVNFDHVSSQLTTGADVSAEWGFSNEGTTINLARNVITAMQSQSTRFTSSGNLDGPSNLDGPQGGLAADPLLMDIGSLGGIQGRVIFTLQLSGDMSMADFHPGGAIIEFGSDAMFVRNVTPVPEPMTFSLLAVGCATFALAARRRHRSRQLA